MYKAKEMVAQSFVIAIVIVVVVLIVLAVLIVTCFRRKEERQGQSEGNTGRRYINRGGRVTTNQQEDVYNISSRVPSQWPTHDAHVSLDHFTIANEYNKYNDEPPTYEEAVRIAAQQSVVVPKTTTTTATVASATSASNQ